MERRRHRRGRCRPRRRALRLQQHGLVPLPAEGRGHADRRGAVHRGGRLVPGGLLRRDRLARRAVGRARRRGLARTHVRRARRPARRPDARGRRAAHRDLLAVERHAGAGLVPPRLRPLRNPVRPDLQGARRAGQPAR